MNWMNTQEIIDEKMNKKLNLNSKLILILIYHIPFIIQVSLLHQNFFKDKYKLYFNFFRIIRFLLIPFNFFIAFNMKNQINLTRGSFNLQFACWVIHLVMKSIEWGLVSSFKNDITYQLRPEFKSNDEKLKSNKLIQITSTSEDTEYTFKDIFIWSLDQLSSLRGINYNWGWKGRNQTKPKLKETIKLMILSHIMQTIGLIGCVLSRDFGTPTAVLLYIGIPNIKGIKLISELLSTLSWGLLCSFGLEFSFCFLTLISHFLNFFKFFNFLNWWDINLFIPLFYNPFYATSISSLWNFHWHQLYRRCFIFLGFLPASKISKKMKLNFKIQRIVGLFGGFIVSGIMHEIVIRFVSTSNEITEYETTKNFPGSFFYFVMQPIGILIEPFVIPLIPRSIGGSRLWVLMFTLITAWPFKNQYTIHYRVVDDIYPPIKDWPIYAFFWSPSIMKI